MKSVAVQHHTLGRRPTLAAALLFLRVDRTSRGRPAVAHPSRRMRRGPDVMGLGHVTARCFGVPQVTREVFVCCLPKMGEICITAICFLLLLFHLCQLPATSTISAFFS